MLPWRVNPIATEAGYVFLLQEIPNIDQSLYQVTIKFVKAWWKIWVISIPVFYLAWNVSGVSESPPTFLLSICSLSELVPLSSHETQGNWAVAHLSLLKVCASKCSFPCLFMRKMITISWFQHFTKQGNFVHPEAYFCIYIKPGGLKVWYMKSFQKILWAETQGNGSNVFESNKSVKYSCCFTIKDPFF